MHGNEKKSFDTVVNMLLSSLLLLLLLLLTMMMMINTLRTRDADLRF